MDFLKKMSKILGFLFLLSLPLLAIPQEKKLKVGIIHTPPFVIVTKNSYSGIAPLIWEKIAEQNNWNYEYVVLGPNINDDLKKVRDGTIDVLADPVSVTHARLKKNEFTRPFVIQTFATVTREIPVYKNIFHDFLRGALTIIGCTALFCFLLYIHLIWFFERGNMTTMPQSYVKAIPYLIWLHLLKRAIGMPQTLYGRIILFLWIILTGLFFTSYNASLTSSLTTALNTHKALTYNDLRGLSIVCIAGQATVGFAQESGLIVQLTNSMENALTLLREKKADVILTYYIAAKHYISMHPEKQRYTVDPLENENFEAAFALAINSPLRRPIDLALTELQDTDVTTDICKKYLSQKDAQLCSL